jgi:secretion/DNA translocation related TadE-like protein
MTRTTGATTTRDRGSATIWTVAVALIVMTSTAAVQLVAVAIAARHRVATAADLSALGAAARLASAQSGGESDAAQQACGVAADIAFANDARISECHVDGSMVEVLAIVRLPSIGYVGAHSASARARAGPS